MNQIILIGRLTKDVDLRIMQDSGKAIARFTLAVNRDFKKEGQPDADFINCVAFDKRAETIANYVKKGHRLGVVGRIQTGAYDKDGVKHFTTDVMVDKIEFLENKNSNSSTNNNQNPQGIPDDYFGEGYVVDDGPIPF